MKLTQEGIDLMHEFEGLELKAYLCPAGKWTIGYGNTFYEDGTKVKKGDEISQERADKLFNNIVSLKFEAPLKKLIKVRLNENQYSALVSFSYNIGITMPSKSKLREGNFNRSTLLKMVNQDPNNPFIREQFLRWNKANGKPLYGLTRRRHAEANLYFKKP